MPRPSPTGDTWRLLVHHLRWPCLPPMEFHGWQKRVDRRADAGSGHLVHGHLGGCPYARRCGVHLCGGPRGHQHDSRRGLPRAAGEVLSI
eukprot:499601-Alexandrium_andersonii.AAC.1